VLASFRRFSIGQRQRLRLARGRLSGLYHYRIPNESYAERELPAADRLFANDDVQRKTINVCNIAVNIDYIAIDLLASEGCRSQRSCSINRKSGVNVPRPRPESSYKVSCAGSLTDTFYCVRCQFRVVSQPTDEVNFFSIGMNML
jgi:hypothetical protein